MAESTGLLNLHTGNRITSSNLVLSAKIPYRALCEGFFVKSGPKNVPFLPKMYQKKLLAGGQLSAKEGSKILDVLFIIFSDIISKILSF